MTVEIKSFIRPTQIVRSVMRAHGKNPYMIFTNSYKHCRTVKCYGSSVEMVGDIRTALVKAGVKHFSCNSKGNPFRSDSFIVRIPRSEQA